MVQEIHVEPTGRGDANYGQRRKLKTNIYYQKLNRFHRTIIEQLL